MQNNLNVHELKNRSQITVLLATFGSLGDVLPFIELGKYLRGLGFDISVMTSPSYQSLVLEQKFSFIPFGSLDSYQATFEHPDIFKMNKSFQTFFGLGVVPYLNTLPEWIEKIPKDKPVWIFSNVALNLSAFLARTKHQNTKVITVYLSPAAILSRRQVWPFGSKIIEWVIPKFLMNPLNWLIEKFFFSDLSKTYSSLRKQYGLKPVKNFLIHWHHSSDFCLILFPKLFQSPYKDWPMPSVQGNFLLRTLRDHTLDQQINQFLKDGPPPVLLMFGSDNRQATYDYDVCIKFFSERNFRIIVLTTSTLKINQANVLCLKPKVNLSEIMAKSFLVIHHGGIGTISQALTAGVPQLVVPFAFDQWGNAKQLEKLGVGYLIPHQTLSEKSLSSALKWVNKSALKNKGKLLAKELAQEKDIYTWLDEVIKFLEESPTNGLSK
jgi:UDP:flavonoid glycosyltransferase YjiC (YdhE family)